MIVSKKKLFLGIDFGTTYSLAATVKNNNVILLLDKNKNYLLPSVVHYKKDSISVGWKALNNVISDPVNTISSIKRLVGRSLDFIKHEFPTLPYFIETDKNGSIVFHTNIGLIRPIDVISEILICLKKRAGVLFDREIDASIITVPAYFNNIQKTEIKESAILAKVNLIRLLNEPTSAAIAYGLQKQKEGIIIVYDLGGGTFDISILKLNKGIFEVLGTSGDSNLGGDDFDFALAKYIYQKSQLCNKYDDIFQSTLLQIAKQTKLKLTIYKKVLVHVLTWTGYITRDEFNLIIIQFIKKTLFICSSILEEIDFSIHDIKDVVMVGGSTRIPLIYKEVSNFFQKVPLISINPDQVVAIGSAIQANMLFSDSKIDKTILLDVIPLSLGIEVMGGFVEKIIFRNTSIPISKTKEFTTYKDNQTSILIHILQGERELVKDCISLSRFVLKNIKPQKAGLVRVLVTFQIDIDGLINITVVEKNNYNKKTIQIDNHILLKTINVSKIVNISLKNAKIDYFFRIKEEKKIESIHVLKILKKAIKKYNNLISKTELITIKNIEKKLQHSIDTDDFFSMKINLKKLDEVTKKFFLLQLKKSIKFSSTKNFLKEDI